MNLEFFIKLREMVSSGLVKMASTAQKTAGAIKGANDNIGQSYDVIKNKIAQLEASISKSTSLKHIRDSRAELEQLMRLQSRSPGNINAQRGGGGMLLGGLRQVLPMMGIAGAIALGGNMLGSGLEAQSRQTSFEVMAGKQEGTRLNKDLTKFAQDSIYGSEVYQASQTMLAFGANSKEVMPDLKMLGDISMGNKDKLGRLTLAFSQVRAAGKLMGQDLLQFVNAGFNPLQIMAEKTGLSLGVLRKKVEEGEISFAMVKEAFQSATSAGGRFYDMTNKIAQTDFGKVEAFKGQLSGLSMQIGGILAPLLGSLVTNVLAPMVTIIQNNIDVIQLLGVVIASGLGVYAAWAAGIWLVTGAKTVWALVTGKLTIAQWALNAALFANPIGLVVAGIAALVAGIVYAWKNFDGFRDSMYGLWEVFKQVFTNIGTFFSQIFDPIFEAIQAFKDGRYLDMGKAVGKMAFNLAVLPMKAVQFAAEGGLTKDVGKAYKVGEEKSAMADLVDAAKKMDDKRDQEKSLLPPKVDVPATNKENAKLTGNQKLLEELRASKAKRMGVEIPTSQTLAGAGAIASLKTGSDDEDKIARGVTSGGPRVININGVKFAEKIEIHATTFEKGMDSVKDQLDEYMLRILNSGAAVQ